MTFLKPRQKFWRKKALSSIHNLIQATSNTDTVKAQRGFFFQDSFLPDDKILLFTRRKCDKNRAQKIKNHHNPIFRISFQPFSGNTNKRVSSSSHCMAKFSFTVKCSFVVSLQYLKGSLCFLQGEKVHFSEITTELTRYS